MLHVKVKWIRLSTGEDVGGDGIDRHNILSISKRERILCQEKGGN